MAESTLSLGYPDFATEVAKKLGYPSDVADRSAAEIAVIDAIIQSGVRQFYFPPLLPGEEHVHEWSFLKPVTTLSTTATDYDYDLPDDFGSIDGDITFASTASVKGPIVKVGEAHIRLWREAGGDVAGSPEFYAIRPRSTGGTTGQRDEILFYPTPDASYTLTYRYVALVSKISTGSPYPLGGMAHCETCLQSCLAVAEMRDIQAQGHEYALFMQRLQSSISHDRNKGSRDYFGKCTDPGNIDEPRSRIDGYPTYNGVNYPT